MLGGLDRLLVVFSFLIIILFFVLFGYFIFNYVKPSEQSYQLGLAITFLVLILSLINYKMGLYAFVVSVGVSPELVVMDTPNFRLEDLIFPVMMISWLTYFLKEKKEFSTTGLTAPLISFLVISIISYLINIGTGNLHNIMTGFYEIGKLIQYFMVLVVFANSFGDSKDIKQCILVMVVSFFISGVIGIMIRQSTPYIYGPPGEGPNVQGGYYALSLCIVVGLLATLSDPLIWLILLGVGASIFYSLVYTLSRTSYIAFVSGVAIVGLFKAKRILLWLILFFTIAVSLKNEAFFERASSILYIFTDKPPSSWEARVSGWQVYSRYFFQAPLLGNGAGFTSRTIDNEYIKILVDKGVLGLVVFIWFLINCAKIAIKSLKVVKEDNILYGYTIGFCAATTAIVAHSIGAVSFTVIRVAELYYMLLGLQIVILNTFNKQKEQLKILEEQVVF